MQIKRRIISEIPEELQNLQPILQRIYAARGLTSARELDKSLQSLLPFQGLKGIAAATQRLELALRNQERVLIIGDFDADGATSTALAVSALRLLGAAEVHYLVPNRFEFGYGLTPAIVEVAKKWQPQLIITVDNGIASSDGVETARAVGIDVLITDHHLPGDTLPSACAIVNPNQNEDTFPSKSMAGVGVIFYVMLALRRQLQQSGWFKERGQQEPNMGQFLDLVALGTVADVVGLDQNNRILVTQGLARIRQGLCRPGILALLEIAGRAHANINETDLGFAVAPRLNAAGRLDDMSLGIECLLCQDMQVARQFAAELDALNQERRQIEAEMKEQALVLVQSMHKKMQTMSSLPPALCLLDESWHQGVIGILAGRLKDQFHRPVIAFAQVSTEELKGSARSVADINIRDILAAIDTKYPELIKKFGGHAMAAGLSIPPVNLSRFQQAFIAEVGQHRSSADCQGILMTDGEIAGNELNLELAQILKQAGPWGQQFPEPCFDGVFEIIEQRLVGKNHLKLTLAHPETLQPLDAIAFNIDTNCWPNHRLHRIHIVYKLDINVYQGRTKLQLMVQHLIPVPQVETIVDIGFAEEVYV